MIREGNIMMTRTGGSAGLILAAGLAIAAAGAVCAQEIHAGVYPQQTGEELFKGICQGCHMPDAKGAVGAGAYPALADNPRLVAPIYPLLVVVNGQRAMPSFGEDLSDEQVANVINYVRTHFGNHYKDAVSPAAVKAVRR
jgi:mono/diheme cytochrome c family protein